MNSDRDALSRPLPTRAQALRLQQAANSLANGQPAEALALARALALELPGSAKVQHLLALSLKACGELGAARHAFEAAERLDARDSQLLANHANLLVALGDATTALVKYRRAVDLDPKNAEAWINLSVVLLRTADAHGAVDAARRAVESASASPASWHALASAQRALGDLDGAAKSLSKAVSLDGRNPSLRLALGVVERLRGKAHTALEHYGIAADLGMKSAEWMDARASAVLDTGATDEAIALARALTEHHPNYAAGHLMLAEMLWEHAADAQEAVDSLERALSRLPDHRELNRGAINLLLAADRIEAATPLIRKLRRDGDSADLAALEAEAHRRSGNIVAALECLADAPDSWRKTIFWRRTQVRVLLGARRAEHAAQAATDTLAWAGYDQELLALLGTAWRLTGDPREQWLCNHEGLVLTIDLDVSPWIAELRELLRQLHLARSAPLRQSLRNGSQTSGNLLGRDEPVLETLRKTLDDAIRSLLVRLPSDAAHPFLCRNTGRSRFVGSWSARLRASGRHVNHFHQEGWLSSAFYVQLPNSVADGTQGNAGCLQFGQPDEGLRLVGLAPQKMIRPKVGRLVLFPSYFWHGTVPFEEPTDRVTIAFDAQPAA